MWDIFPKFLERSYTNIHYKLTHFWKDGNRMKKFDVVTEFGIYKNCYLVVKKYAVDDSLCLQVANDEDGSICILTVFTGQWGVDMQTVDINNCPFAPKLIDELGIGIDTLRSCRSGFCYYPVYIFNLEKIKEYTKEGM